MKSLCAKLLIIVVIVFFLSTAVNVFEDGSWGLGKFPYFIRGCLPKSECENVDIHIEFQNFPNFFSTDPGYNFFEQDGV